MDVDHQRLVWLSAPRLTAAEGYSPEAVFIWPAAYLVWQTAPRLTNAFCYSRYQGIPTPLSTSGHREYQNLPLLCGGRPLYQRPSKEIPTLLMSHKSTPGDTNTPVNTAERLTLVQRQPYRLCRTYRLFSSRLTLHTEESLSSRLQQTSFNDRSVIIM